MRFIIQNVALREICDLFSVQRFRKKIVMVQIPIKVTEGVGACPEWVVVDMQGDIETRHPVPLGGKFIGDLHFTQKNVPILIVGHHILYGKTVDLDKPYAVLVKDQTDQSGSSETVTMEIDQRSDACRSSYTVKALIRKKILFKTRPKPIIANVPKKL